MAYDALVIAPTRETLTRERIIEAAVSFADNHGVEALSMRKLGAELDVEAMSLYNHVANKDDIFDGMIDFVFASIPLPQRSEDWKDAIRRVGMAAMDAFTIHPWTVVLVTARGNQGTAAIRFMDRVIGVFTDAGFSDEDAHHAWQMLASHTVGYAFQQTTDMGAEHHDVRSAAARSAPADGEFPNVARLGPLIECCDHRAEFAFGLGVIVDGFEARLA